MTQPHTVDELLGQWGAAVRATLPSPQERQHRVDALHLRLAAIQQTGLHAENVVACTLCLCRRPRTSDDEPLYYPADECANVRKPWHYHRAGTSRAADNREKRRHIRRLRKGRLPHTPTTAGAGA